MRELLDSLYRVDSGRILATLIRLLGDVGDRLEVNNFEQMSVLRFFQFRSSSRSNLLWDRTEVNCAAGESDCSPS
jgi:hypothetical protein